MPAVVSPELVGRVPEIARLKDSLEAEAVAYAARTFGHPAP